MKHSLYSLITIIVLLFHEAYAIAGGGRLFTADKLSSSQINCICQDGYGYIWIGTEYGLNRFDGYHFVSYLHSDRDTTSISSNVISSLLCDNDGNLWVGTSNGLALYDYAGDMFRRLKFEDGNTPRANSLALTRKGELLVGSAGYGLLKVDKEKMMAFEVENRTNCVQENFFSRICVDSRGYLWKGSHIPDFSMIKEKNGALVKARNFKSECGPPVSFIERDGRMLIACMYGLLEYDYQTETLSRPTIDMGSWGDADMVIRRALKDHRGNIYIGTRGKGLFVIRKGSGKLERPDYDGLFNLESSNVNYVFEDRDENIWVGCFRKGLLMLNDQKEAFTQWDFARQHYPIGSCVSSIAEGDNGDTWCTVENNGVYKLDSLGRIVAHPSAPFDTRLIYRDKSGSYWLCTEKALYSYNPDKGTYNQELTFEGWGLNCIVGDGKGHLFISNYGKGLVVYDIAEKKATAFSMNSNSNNGNGILNDWIISMATDNKGRMWIGTSDGLECLDTYIMKSVELPNIDKKQVLKYLQCTAIAAMPSGDMMICTDRGVFIYEVERGKIRSLDGGEQLAGKNIGGVVVDKKGDIWFSTSSGIWQYDQNQKKLIGHISGNGLSTGEYIAGALCHYRDDKIGLGTADGITVFYPEEVKSFDSRLGEVYLTNFTVRGKSMDPTSDYFEVPYSENSFAMEFSLFNYRNADNISYQYRINGGNEWSATAEGDNMITLNKLQPGKYVVEVRAYSNGMASNKVKTITVIVRQPWYKSTLAKVIYLLLAILLAWQAFTLYSRRKKGELEEEKMRFLINATHDIRSPLTLIMGPLHKLQQRARDAGDAADKESMEDLDTIERNAKRLMLLVNQILDERKIDKNQMHLTCSKTNLVAFLEGVTNLYKYNANERNISLSFEHEDDKLYAWVDRIQFDKVISNLLSNAFKYTFGGGEVKVILSKTDGGKAGDEGSAVIKVIDSGIGFKDEKTDRLFDRFYQGKNADDLHIQGSGIGLNLCKAIVNMHHGTIKASNREDKTGACLTVTIPLGNKHFKPEELKQEEIATPDASSGKKANGNVRILIADDDPEIGHYINHELGEWYRFDYCPNGKEALKMLLTKSYHLVISDVMMPEMDGITLLKNIKSNTNISDVPVILLTSRSEVSERLEGLKKGADAFLSKPFNIDELHILIDNLIGNVRRLKGKYSGAQEQKDKVENVAVVGNNDQLMKRVMTSINKHLSDSDFNIEVLTAEVGMSRAQLHRKMKEITGLTTSEFIRNIRLKQAAKLLLEHKINVTQIAYEVGFSNQAHFSTVFKRFYGVTPSEYAEGKGKKEE